MVEYLQQKGPACITISNFDKGWTSETLRSGSGAAPGIYPAEGVHTGVGGSRGYDESVYEC